ncbi:peptidylprolyl isomerase [Rhodococcus sp. B50]|uniref:peptidylprolyl isomerase n=1 Tax=Rhodococcus sp. B50 TaxID=2682847 RepID=UPI001BD5DC1D|nr:peptidylprolyl isomerase [Rhodococcus sp. B50]MBS9372525.1 putative peptidyl-prolyl cis-trans isomerase B [Rhodococcus sp. B50]
MIHTTGRRFAVRLRTVVPLCLVAVASLLGGCAQDAGSATTKVTEVAQPRSAPPRDLSIYRGLPEVPAQAGPTVTCDYVDRGGTLPPSSASTVGIVESTLDTSIGPVPLVLDRTQAPCTVNSFVDLAHRGFYDGTSCHRLATDPGGQLYQCGDPTGTGSGGPGYTFADEYPVPQFTAEAATSYLPPAVLYPRGTIAMANTGVENSNGSQFFLLLGDSLLRPDFTAFGRIGDAGMSVLEAAAAHGHDGSSPLGGGVPTKPVVIGAVR